MPTVERSTSYSIWNSNCLNNSALYIASALIAIGIVGSLLGALNAMSTTYFYAGLALTISGASLYGYARSQPRKNNENSSEYTSEYVNAHVDSTTWNAIEEWKGKRIGNGEYRSLNILTEDGKEVHCLRFSHELHFYKTQQELDEARTGHFNGEDLDKAFEERFKEVMFLPRGTFWISKIPVSIQKFNAGEAPVFLVFVKRPDSNEVLKSHFPSLKGLEITLERLRVLKNAKKEEGKPDRFAARWVEERSSPGNSDHKLAEIELEGEKIFVFKENLDPIYFASEEARIKHIKKLKNKKLLRESL